MKAHVTVAEFALLISGADHRVIESIVMPAGLIADIIINERKHYLHQLVRYVAASCNSQSIHARQFYTVHVNAKQCSHFQNCKAFEYLV